MFLEWVNLPEKTKEQMNIKYAKKIAFEQQIQQTLNKPTYAIQYEKKTVKVPKFNGTECRKLINADEALWKCLDDSPDTLRVWKVSILIWMFIPLIVRS